jgi:histidine ammonia-lyase
MNGNLAGIVAVEAMAAAQGVEFRAPLKTSKPLQTVIAAIRERSARVTDDRMLSGDIDALKALCLETTVLSDIASATPMALAER